MERLNSLRLHSPQPDRGWPLEPGTWKLFWAVYCHCTMVLMQPLQWWLCCSLIQLSVRIFKSCQKGCLEGSWVPKQPFWAASWDSCPGQGLLGSLEMAHSSSSPVITAQLVQGIESTSSAELSSVLTLLNSHPDNINKAQNENGLTLLLGVQDYLQLRAVTTDCCPGMHVLLWQHWATHKFLCGSMLFLRETSSGWQDNQNCHWQLI